MDEKMVYYKGGKCPICGLLSKLTKEGCCPKCMTALNYDNEDLDNKAIENSFWSDTDYPI